MSVKPDHEVSSSRALVHVDRVESDESPRADARLSRKRAHSDGSRMATIAIRTLCQDCLAPNPYTDPIGSCRLCGAECCDCRDCMLTLDRLLEGERRADHLGCSGPDLAFWSPCAGWARGTS